MAKKETYRNVRKERYTQVSNGLLNDKEATLQAKGLLSIFLSNSVDWEIHMANIITRSKNGRDAHYTVVKELIKLGYFARIQVTNNGRFEEMVYIFSDIKTDVADELERMKEWASEQGKTLKIEYMDYGKTPEVSPVTENQETEKAVAESQYNNNTKRNNTKNNNTKKYIKIDDDKRTSPPEEDTDQLNEVISEVYEEVKDELTKRSYQAIVRKVVDKHRQGKIRKGSFRDYLTSAISNKLEELDLRRIKEQAQEAIKQHKPNGQPAVMERPVPFYNWLEE